MNKDALCELFQSSRQKLEYHIKTILLEGELEENRTCKKILQVQMEDNREFVR